MTNILNKNSKKILLILICILSMGLITACGPKDSGNDEEKSVEYSFKKPYEKFPEGKNVYIIFPSSSEKYWQMAEAGTMIAGSNFRCNTYCARCSRTMTADDQIEFIDMAVKEGADAIILGPVDSQKLVVSVDRVKEAGIPIAILDSEVNTKSYDVSYMTDNLQAGKIAAEEILTMMYEDGISEMEKLKVGISVGDNLSPNENERLSGFIQYWVTNAPKNWSLLSSINAINKDENEAEEQANFILETNENVRVLFGTDEISTEGLAKVVADNRRTDIYIAGFGYTTSMKKMVEDSEYKAIALLQNAYLMGYNAVVATSNVMSGVNMTSKYVDTGIVVAKNSSLDDLKVMDAIEQN